MFKAFLLLCEALLYRFDTDNSNDLKNYFITFVNTK